MGVGRKFWGGFFLVLLAGAVTGCVRVEAGERRRFQTVFVGSMDTVTRFTAYCRDDAEFDRACEQVREGLEEADALFNAYRADSALSRVNAGAGAGPIFSLKTKEPSYRYRIDRKDSRNRFSGPPRAPGTWPAPVSYTHLNDINLWKRNRSEKSSPNAWRWNSKTATW